MINILQLNRQRDILVGTVNRPNVLYSLLNLVENYLEKCVHFECFSLQAQSQALSPHK